MIGIALFVLALAFFCSEKVAATAPDERGLCDHWVWPPTGTKHCANDTDCAGVGTAGRELSCQGCMPTSCSCDLMTGGRRRTDNSRPATRHNHLLHGTDSVLHLVQYPVDSPVLLVCGTDGARVRNGAPVETKRPARQRVGEWRRRPPRAEIMCTASRMNDIVWAGSSRGKKP
eukprot:scaffold27601_cov130-Isochrysis_galbana.AAC.1